MSNERKTQKLITLEKLLENDIHFQPVMRENYDQLQNLSINSNGIAFNNAVTQIYNGHIQNINNEINYVYNQFNLQDFSKLKSISFFLQEVYLDINNSWFSKEEAQATLTNVQKYRIDLKELFYKYLELIRLNIDQRQNFIPINELAYNYVSCRFCVSLYTISLVTETILSNRWDDHRLKSLKQKVTDTLDEFNRLTDEVNTTLKARFYNNKQQIDYAAYDWACDQLFILHKSNENFDLKNFASNNISYFDPNLELQKIDEIFEARSKLLSNIVIKPEE